jgi:hypothetical protein
VVRAHCEEFFLSDELILLSFCMMSQLSYSQSSTQLLTCRLYEGLQVVLLFIEVHILHAHARVHVVVTCKSGSEFGVRRVRSDMLLASVPGAV